MSFLEPALVYGQWFELDGPAGTEWVDADLIDKPKEFLARIEAENEEVSGGFRYDPIPAPLADYCENTKASHIRLVKGWGARLSAPGYLDCTPWCVFGTKKEAKEYLKEQQGDE